MCGINGIVGINKLDSGNIIKNMNQALRHRGPDDEGVFVTENIALGHRRLSIIDLSSAGHQPMESTDGRYTIVYNGELYNYKEVKLQIKDYHFKTNTDTEVILAAYSKWGVGCLEQFNGMFAFAIWDRKMDELFIARDRLGIKPLYYFRKSQDQRAEKGEKTKNNFIVFSSEIRALLASALIPRKLDKDGLVDYLRYLSVNAPNTIINDVKMLLPGHYMVINRGSKENDIAIHKYWNLGGNIDTSVSKKSYSEVCSDVYSLLLKSVERRLIADVPFGAFLSGGIDSSAIVGLMSKISPNKVKTFSVVFNEQEFSEAPYARLIAKKFNTDHHEINLKISDFIDELPSALTAMDHPSGDAINTYVVSKVTKHAGITMALSGLGGDELFAGYDIFKQTMKLKNNEWLNSFPSFIRGWAGDILGMVKPGIAAEKIKRLLTQNSINFNTFYPLSRQVFMDEQICNLLNLETLPINSVIDILEQTCHPQSVINNLSTTSNYQQTTISTVSIAEISTYMQNILLRDTDQMSMAHALEVRVPFLDYKLVEYVLSIPDKYKQNNEIKKLLIDSLGDMLPPEIYNRPKMGFVLPWKNWLKNELKDFCIEKLNSLSNRKSFNKITIDKLWNDFLLNEPTVSWSRIWLLVVLECWLIINEIHD